jgi:tryptophan halogenase
MVVARYDRIIDFIKMHYCLSQRRDHAFWIDNAQPDSITDALKDRLALWRHRPPHRLDFVGDLEMFLVSSWQYVLYGMEFRTDLAPMRSMYRRTDEARREFAMIRQMAEHAMDELPGHRQLVEQMVAGHHRRAATAVA